MSSYATYNLQQITNGWLVADEENQVAYFGELEDAVEFLAEVAEQNAHVEETEEVPS